MPQLVGVARHVDGDNPPVHEVQSGSLQDAAGLDGDEARQTVDRRIADEV